MLRDNIVQKGEHMTPNPFKQMPMSALNPLNAVHNLLTAITSSGTLASGITIPPKIQRLTYLPNSNPLEPNNTNKPSPILSFDISMSQASTYVHHRVALLGDAAHTIHPMAGQGLNLGIEDSICLGNLIVEGAKVDGTGLDIGSPYTLEKYHTSRSQANLVLMGFLDFLHRLYDSNDTKVTWLRNMGMGTLNTLSPIKKVIVDYAAGKR